MKKNKEKPTNVSERETANASTKDAREQPSKDRQQGGADSVPADQLVVGIPGGQEDKRQNEADADGEGYETERSGAV